MKTKSIHSRVVLITVYRCKSWTVKKADRGEMIIQNVVLEESFMDNVYCQKEK